MRSCPSKIILAFSLGLGTMALAMWAHQYWATHSCQYKMTSPLLCQVRLASQKREYTELRQQIQQLLEQKKAEGSLNYASVYFRDLDNGPIFEINQYQDFVAASLLKVPVLITYLKHAEVETNLLNQTIHTPDTVTNTQVILPPKELIQPNTDYTVEELIRRLIVYSDNQSAMLLEDYAKTNLPDVRDTVLQTLVELGILPRTDTNNHYLTNIKELAGMLRVLYTVGYLSPEMSEYALRLMSTTEFKDGLVAGIPNGIKVAHKFGVSTDVNHIELHDIGIVYGPNFHYLVGVMTNGRSIETNAQTIREISRMVWEATLR